MARVVDEDTGLSVQVLTVGSVSADQAWQFRPESYGAKGDGKVANDISTNGTQTFSSPTMAANAVVGQWVMIDGGRGTGDTAAIGKITAIAGNNITISQPTMFGGVALPINATASSLPAVYGTDDQVAINAAITAANTYAQANNYFAEVLFKDKVYMVAGSPTQTANSPAYYNTQLLIPYPTDNSRKLTIGFRGVGDNTALQFWGSNNPQLTGSVICSVQTAPSSIDGTYGPQSVLGAPTSNAGFTSGGANPNWPNIKPVIEGIEIMMPMYTNMTGIDLTWAAGCKVDASVQVFAVPLNGNGVLLNSQYTDTGVFGTRQGTGLRCPKQGNNADIWIPNIAIEGTTFGIFVEEHARIGNMKTIYNATVISIGDTTDHGVEILGWTAEAYQVAIKTNAAGPCRVKIRMVTEGNAATYDVNDTNNALRGTIDFIDATGSRTPAVNGATKVRIINDAVGTGYWSGAPAVPATTVNVAQTAMPWRDAQVFVTGGTVTAITVDGQATGATSGWVFVPAGKTINVTYSSAPTWKWWLF